MNPTEEALAGMSRALREGTRAIERVLAEHSVKDLPTPVIEALTEVTDALAKALAAVEGFGQAERHWMSRLPSLE
jgi:hypothetical protein